MDNLISNIFVYGTLQRAQERGNQWPREPKSIVSAWTLGKLFDTGPYPALVGGTDHVLGELWCFEPQDMEATLAVLDAIEGTNQPGYENDYDRVVADVFVLDETLDFAESAATSLPSTKAYVYHFAKTDLLPYFRYVEPTQTDGRIAFAKWPSHGSTQA